MKPTLQFAYPTLAILFVPAALASCHRSPREPAVESNPTGPSPTAKAVQQQTHDYSKPSWGNGLHLCVDPGAASCATSSDSNDCSCTCTGGGIGPCLHRSKLVNNWGGCPTFTQTTTETFLSPQTDDSDPIAICPTLTNSASYVFQCALPTATHTGTLTNAINFPGGNRIVDTGYANMTLPGYFFTVTDSGNTAHLWASARNPLVANSAIMDMPVNPTPPPTSVLAPALWTTSPGGANNGNGFSAGDAYTQYALNTVDIYSILPTIDTWNYVDSGADAGTAIGSGVFLYQCNLFDPAGEAGANMVQWGPGVTGYDLRIDRTINLAGNASIKDEGCVNCWINGGIVGGRLGTGNYWHVIAGEITGNGPVVTNPTGTGIALDGYPTVLGNTVWENGVSIGLLLLGGSGNVVTMGYSTLAPLSPGYAVGTPNSVDNGVLVRSSAGGFNVIGSGTLHYDTAFGGAEGVLKPTTIPLLANSQSTGCLYFDGGTVSGWTVYNTACGALINPPDLDDAGVFNGNAFGQYGGRYVGMIP